MNQVLNMSLFSVPHLYFVSHSTTLRLPVQPSVPFDVSQSRALALQQVGPSYTPELFGKSWTLVVAYNDHEAANVGLAHLQP